MAKQVTKKAVAAKAPVKKTNPMAKAAISGAKVSAKRNSAMDSLQADQRNSIRKIATYSTGATKSGYDGYVDRTGSQKRFVSPQDSVLKYSDKLKKTNSAIAKLKKKK